MSTRRSDIRKDLLDALRGDNGASERESTRAGNGASLRDALKPRERDGAAPETERGGNGASAPDAAGARESVPTRRTRRRTSRPPRRTTRPERNEALSFEGIRARAREMMRGFRESSTRAG
ncbi:MAG: hypothetical protein ACRDL1_01865, partial [Solirubrobacterales bacterium]